MTLSLLDLNHDCYGEILKKLNDRNLMLFLMTSKAIASESPLSHYRVNRSRIAIDAAGDGYLPVMEYLLKELKYNYDYKCLFAANRDRVGVFQWLLNQACPGWYRNEVQIRLVIGAYTQFVCAALTIEIAKDAYLAIVEQIKKSCLGPTYLRVPGVVVKNFPVISLLCIYNRLG